MTDDTGPRQALIVFAARRSRRGQRPDPALEMEMLRRLKGAVVALAAELVTFREAAGAAAESADAAADRADAAARKLVRLTSVLIGFTVVLVILTLVVIALTCALPANG